MFWLVEWRHKTRVPLGPIRIPEAISLFQISSPLFQHNPLISHYPIFQDTLDCLAMLQDYGNGHRWSCTNYLDPPWSTGYKVLRMFTHGATALYWTWCWDILASGRSLSWLCWLCLFWCYHWWCHRCRLHLCCFYLFQFWSWPFCFSWLFLHQITQI